ncbi:50S ribosome-binding GTPase [Rhodomicrobium vannielii ATCC 17100]|nr:GTP-binding protein [Rhodomicrobium vannielii]MBJ7534356.1 50S ribosome-binding GTPase [Rhodomicrobium vannielii ATCC 17100]
MRFDTSDAFAGAEPASEIEAYRKPPVTERKTAPELNGIVRLLTCGSVDDGKSTLIGRLLWDASPLYDDQREKLLKETASLHGASRPDFSRLVDGLVAEQEQGITIDIAWHYFDTPHRRVVIIDSPGHEQYTRNMATGASHADVAVLLVDAQAGIKRQTRRHLAILDLAGVRKVVLAVNKMDLIGWDKERFDAIVDDFVSSVARFPRLSWIAIPVSALNGDNVATRSQAMSWYKGPTFVEHLETVGSRADNAHESFRMPVQIVLRDGKGFRGFGGRITAGTIRVGDAVSDALSGRSSTIASIRTMDGDLEAARSGQSVVIELADHIDVSRGSVLTTEKGEVRTGRRLEARIVWLANEPYSNTQGYLLRTATDMVPVVSLKILGRLDLDTLELNAAATLEPNGIAEARIDLARAIAADRFTDHRGTGAFVLVDAVTGAAVAGGVIREVSAGVAADKGAFLLSSELLWRGLCSDLANADDTDAEFRRRANEVAIILRAAGVPVEFAA